MRLSVGWQALESMRKPIWGAGQRVPGPDCTCLACGNHANGSKAYK